MFGKAFTDCLLGLIIQAIEILGLKLLEVLWDGVWKQEQAQRVRKAPSTGILVYLVLCKRPVGVAVSPSNRPQKAPQPFSTSGCFANCWLKAQECSFTGLKEISRQNGF